MLKRFFFVIFVFFFFVSFHNKTLASEYFSTAYFVTYNVENSGNTRADIRVTLTNKTPDYYASSYKIEVGFPTISNVSGTDPGGVLKPTVEKSENGNIISVDFNERAVGQGKTLTYTISLDTPDIAKSHGSVWEINIPGISDPGAFDEFTVEVKVPESFGKPAYIKPAQSSSSTIFTKDQLGSSGVSIAYGSKQVFTFNLKYHLRNTNVFPVKTEIALPPSTNYQEVEIDKIEPRPENVVKDQDGNWLAEYRLSPSEILDVKVIGKASVSLIPKKVHLSQKDRALYLEEQPFWETTSPQIKRLAQELKTAENIYNYLVTELSYDHSRDFTSGDSQVRLGGLNTLRKPSEAVCLEFTDLFITLARAAGIPAREVDGYANTENDRQRPLSLVQDILHAWPEYYDDQKQTWVMVDPTWGNTTGGIDYFNVLDFDHLAFAIKGVDSEYPVPAGGYKYSGDEQLKDVNIGFADDFGTETQQVSFQPLTNSPYIAGLPIRGEIIVKNTGKIMTSTSEMTLSSQTLSPSQKKAVIPEIPPFGYVRMPFEYDRTTFLTNESYKITIAVASKRLEETIRVLPIFLTVYALIGGILVVVLTTIVFIIARRPRRVPVS